MRGRDVRRSEWHHVWNLYRSSIIIFMMCQNFYNSEKNIVLIIRQSEYFIICYLHKSHFIMMQQVSGIYTETLYNYSESSQLWTPSWCESSKVIMRQWQPNEGVFPVLTWPWVTPGDWNRFLQTSSPRIPCIMQLLAPHHLLLASSDPIIIPGPLSTFWSIIYKWPVKLRSGGFWMMDLRAHLKSCREVRAPRITGIMPLKNSQDIPMTKMGNITVKKSEFQSVNLVISKLTAMFLVTPPSSYPRNSNSWFFLISGMSITVTGLLHWISFLFSLKHLTEYSEHSVVIKNILKTEKWLPSGPSVTRIH